MSVRLNKIELEQRLKESIEKLNEIPTGTKERRNLLNNIGKLKKKIEERKDEKEMLRMPKIKKEQLKTTNEKDALIFKEVWFTTTHKNTKEDYTKYKHKDIEIEEGFYCSKCGKLTNEKYYIDVFNLNKGFVCKECNEKYFDNKAIKILV